MNVKFEDLNCEDVGKMLKLDKSTISAWCRKGYINYQDVSEPGSKRPRYLIPQWEFDRVSKLIRKYGKRNWILYNADSKDDTAAKYWIEENVLTYQPEGVKAVEIPEKEEQKEPEETPAKRIQMNVDITEEDKKLIESEAEKLGMTKADYVRSVLRKKPTPIEEIHHDKPFSSLKFDADKMLNTILYIQDIKERLNDLEAEKNQLLNELEMMKKEVMDTMEA